MTKLSVRSWSLVLGLLSLSIPNLLFVSNLPAQTTTQGTRTYVGAGNFCDNTSPNDNYACTYPSGGLAAYVHGTCYSMYTSIGNTGPATVDLGPGQKALVNGSGAALTTGDIPANSQFHFCYVQPQDVMRLMIGVSNASVSPPYIQLFSNTPGFTVLGLTHGQGANVDVKVQWEPSPDVWDDLLCPKRIDKATGNVTVTFAGNRSGRIMITQMAGANQGPSIPTDHAALTNKGYDQSGHTGFAREVHGSRHKWNGADPIADGEPTVGGIPRAFNGVELHPGWLPIFTQDYQGAVPPPGPGHSTDCLLGSGIWGPCAEGAGGGVSGFGPQGGPYRPGNVYIQSGDLAAGVVGFTPAGTLSSGNVNDALLELASESVQNSTKGQPDGVASLDSGGKVPRSQLPLATPDLGSGGLAGAVPAPGAGDADKCLKGSMAYGPCGGGSASGIDAYLPNGNLLQAGVSRIRLLGAGVVSSTYDSLNSRWDISIDGGGGGGGGGSCSAGGSYACTSGNQTVAGNIDLNIGNSQFSVSVPNDSTNPTTLYKLVTLTTSGNPAAATTATTGEGMILGVCKGNCSNSGLAQIATKGTTLCLFQTPPTQRHWVTVGTNGTCLGSASKPTNTPILGVVLDADNVGGKYKVYLF